MTVRAGAAWLGERARDLSATVESTGSIAGGGGLWGSEPHPEGRPASASIGAGKRSAASGASTGAGSSRPVPAAYPGLGGRLWDWLQARRGEQARSGRLRVRETASLGEKRFVAVVEVSGRSFLVGGGATGVALLAQLPADAGTSIEERLGGESPIEAPALEEMPTEESAYEAAVTSGLRYGPAASPALRPVSNERSRFGDILGSMLRVEDGWEA